MLLRVLPPRSRRPVWLVLGFYYLAGLLTTAVLGASMSFLPGHELRAAVQAGAWQLASLIGQGAVIGAIPFAFTGALILGFYAGALYMAQQTSGGIRAVVLIGAAATGVLATSITIAPAFAPRSPDRTVWVINAVVLSLIAIAAFIHAPKSAHEAVFGWYLPNSIAHVSLPLLEKSLTRAQERRAGQRTPAPALSDATTAHGDR